MEFIKTYGFTIAGVVIGAVGGYLYYAKIGCASGTCPITSSPHISTIYGAIMGGLTVNIFTK
ncbi:MAG: DUF6132 family protein [Flavobacteriales bacterium]